MLNIVFVHPDLGIGGAERAVVDAAVALKSRGHQVTMLTAHHDTSHCFDETRNGTLSVTVVGDWLPRSLFGRCRALCAYVRMVVVAAYLVFFSGIPCDVVLCDQVSACIPVLRCSRQHIKVSHSHSLLVDWRTNLLPSSNSHTGLLVNWMVRTLVCLRMCLLEICWKIWIIGLLLT